MGKGSLHKICHTYPTTKKLGKVISYLKKFQKIYEPCDTTLEFWWHQQLSQEISKLCYMKKYRYRLHFNALVLILLALWGPLKVILITMAAIFIMAAKLATLDLLRIKVFWSKSYDVITSVHDIITSFHDVTNKILSRDWNYILDVVMWPKIGVREVITTSIL